MKLRATIYDYGKVCSFTHKSHTARDFVDPLAAIPVPPLEDLFNVLKQIIISFNLV